MTIKKLKIGLIIESLNVQAWIFHAVERIYHLDFVELSIILLRPKNDIEDKEQSKNSNLKMGPWGFQILNSLDKKFFVRNKNAFISKKLDDLFQDTLILQVNPVIKDGRLTLFPEAIETISESDPDILINFGLGKLDGEITKLAKYGVWEYRFGGQKVDKRAIAGYWEVVRKKMTTNASLYALGGIFQSGRTLYKSQIATYFFSTARNQNSIFWFASSFLFRQLNLLSEFGEERLILESERFNKAEQPSERENETFPSSLQAFFYLLIILWRIFKEAVMRLSHKDYWYLLLDSRNGTNLDIENLKKLSSSSESFWADPFIIEENDFHYLFVEEFIYKKKKGIISVIPYNPQKENQESIPVLEKEFHLSYPCVFKSDGNFFMIPESASNQTIDLYQCDSFPTKWKYAMTLMDGVSAVDSTMFFYNNKWWLFTGIRETQGVYPDVELFLFYADTLFTTNWTSHPLNPVVSDVTNARPAGQVFLRDGKLLRPAQNCTGIYGSSFNLNEITCLSENDYKEKKVGTIAPDWDKKDLATHTYNQTGSLRVIDAFYRKLKIFN